MATLGIAACGLLVCLALFVSKKRHYKNYLLVAAICAVLVAGIWLLDVQRPQDYYGQTAARQEPIGQVTLSIRCDTIVGLKESPYIPASGEILPPTAFPIARVYSHSIRSPSARAYAPQPTSGDTPFT